MSQRGSHEIQVQDWEKGQILLLSNVDRMTIYSIKYSDNHVLRFRKGIISITTLCVCDCYLRNTPQYTQHASSGDNHDPPSCSVLNFHCQATFSPHCKTNKKKKSWWPQPHSARGRKSIRARMREFHFNLNANTRSKFIPSEDPGSICPGQ